MELFSAQFLSALFAIVIIDLVLAGDNAIVIALAARNLPEKLRFKAIAWGTLGAIVVRTAMTLIVVWLLKIPGLLLAGGAMLIWIAYKLLVDDSGESHEMEGARNFWGAMKTIVVADALMGLDNVLAVAGAAHGSFLLVVLGLLISIPIVIGGSQLILKFVERYPAIVYIGSGVLAWTAVKMMTSEPLVKDYLADHRAVIVLAYLLVVGGVLGAGFLRKHAAARERVAAHLVDVEVTPTAAPADAGFTKGAANMWKVMIPVDGSPNSLKAVRHVVNRYMGDSALEVHVLHVSTPLSQHAARFLNRNIRAAYHRDAAEKALASARALLNQFGVPHAVHVEMGDKAETIHRVAQRLRVDQIVIGTARQSSFTRMLQDSVTNRVLEITQVPVEVVAGEAVSPLERYGLPASVGAAALALAYLAVD